MDSLQYTTSHITWQQDAQKRKQKYIMLYFPALLTLPQLLRSLCGKTWKHSPFSLCNMYIWYTIENRKGRSRRWTTFKDLTKLCHGFISWYSSSYQLKSTNKCTHSMFRAIKKLRWTNKCQLKWKREKINKVMQEFHLIIL